MYIARRVVDGKLHFRISHSYKKERWWRNEDLVDLGPDPGRFVLPSGRDGGFVITELIRKELCGRGIRPQAGELEELFLEFAPAHLRKIDGKEKVGNEGRRRRRLREGERKRLEAEIALFDRRRLHYLVWGDFDLSAINILPIEVFQLLADKSRDEIEQDLLRREQVLAPEEYNRYVFAVFNLQPYFIYLENGAMPAGTERESLDLLFIEELCQINASSWFWMEEVPPARFHPHLIRYPVMFFDYDLKPGVSWEDYLRDSGRRSPSFAADGSEEKATELFGISVAQVRALSDHDLHSLYKKRALALHPDHGGDQEEFIRLRKTYEEIMKERG
jgi:hypothetical protein